MSKRAEIIHGISATRASAILGMNKWKTPLLAWQEIMEKLKPGFNAERGFILPPREDKAVFRWGNAFESAVIELSEQTQDSKIGYQEHLCRDHGNPESFCYIDGMYQTTGRTMHEGKTTFERAFYKSWGEPGTDRVPNHVAIQAQHNMMCSDVYTVADECIVSVLVFPFSVDDLDYENGGGWEIMNDGNDYWIESYPRGAISGSTIIHPIDWARPLAQQGYFHQYPIQSKPDTHKLLREMYVDFWNKYVLTETPPEIDDYEDIRRIFPAPKGTLVVSGDMASKFREYADIGSELGAGGYLKKKQVQLKEEILKFSLDKTTVADDESQEKIIFMDESGNSIGSFNGKTFRAKK